jgi:hypothetical protein
MTTWVDEVLAGDPRYTISNDAGTPIYTNVRIDLETDVVTPATPVNAANLNALEAAVTGGAPETTAENDFQVGDGAGAWIKKTLVETLTIIGKAVASGLASLDANSRVVQNPADATDTASSGAIPIADIDGKLDTWITDSSKTAKGKVELATTAEINTGTDTERAIPIDQFVASNRNVRYAIIRFIEAETEWPADATAKVGGAVPLPFTGTLVSIKGDSDTPGTTGTAIVDANLNDTTIMTTNKLKWDSTEKSTATYSGTAAELTTTAVTAGDLFSIDIDTNHTTKSKGLTVTVGIRMT